MRHEGYVQTGDDADGLDLHKIRKSYDRNVVLHDLSLKLGKGKLLSLLGPSGCGKTTTLNIIAGFVGLDAGEVRLGGKGITADPPNRRDTAIVFQNYALFPHMSVKANVGYGLKARKVAGKAASTRVSEMLELLDIEKLGDRYPGELSGGQQQRVSLARAIAVHPSLLLLDEPLSNLDTKLRQAIRLEIRKLQQELQQTAVFVTHDQEEALVISDYIAVLNEGWLEQYGTPKELWEQPQTVYVASFMGVENIVQVSNEGNRLRVIEPGSSYGAVVPLSPGEYSHVGFRPASARIAIGNHQSSDSSDSSLVLAATVTAKAYMGTNFRYTCDVHGDSTRLLQVEQPVGAVQAQEGDVVAVIVPMEGLLPLVMSPNDRSRLHGADQAA